MPWGHRGREDSRPSVVVSEMVEEGGNFECLADLCGCVTVGFLVPVCRCGEELQGFGSCRAIWVLEQVVRVVGRVLADRVGQWAMGVGGCNDVAVYEVGY